MLRWRPALPKELTFLRYTGGKERRRPVSTKGRQLNQAKPRKRPASRLGMRLPADDIAAILAQGSALVEASRAPDAVGLLGAAHRRYPGDARILKLNARALLAVGRNDLAIGALVQAAELVPDDAAIHFALGILLHRQGESENALPYSVAAYRLVPDHLHATALSCVLIALGRYDDALATSDHALSLQPEHLDALMNRGLCLQGLGRFEDAVIAGRRAVTVGPDHALARYNLASALLGLGRMTAEAWTLFESRLGLDGNPAWLTATANWRWRGEDIAGRTILLQAEQGFGDTLQFVRYAPLVARRAGRVVLMVQPALARLLRNVPGVDQVVAIGDPIPPVDLVCPLLSLPGLFETTLETIPPALPYNDLPLPSDVPDMGVLRVGLVWAGSRTFTDDRQRSLAAADLAGLAGVPGVQFYSLQRHEPGRDKLPAELGAIDLMAEVTDFFDTARRVMQMDLVVAVDTGVAHLAATMGKPVWLLSRWRGCWRWLQQRTDSPWYPSVRIFRQVQPDDWTAVLEQVRQQLIAASSPCRSE